MNKQTFDELARAWADFEQQGNRSEQNRCVGRAIMMDGVEDFIDQHKDGWLGVQGAFARRVARALSQI